MHEFSIAEGLLDVILKRAVAMGNVRIDSVKLEIGALSGVEEDALRLAFSALSAGTAAESAELVVDHVPIRCRCPDCGGLFECPPLEYACPDCGQAATELVTGREMTVVSMEVNEHV